MSEFVGDGYYRQIQRLQAALADAEALEMGTAETLAKAQIRIKELEETNTQLREGYSVMNKDWLKIQDEKVEQAARIKVLEGALLGFVNHPADDADYPPPYKIAREALTSAKLFKSN